MTIKKFQGKTEAEADCQSEGGVWGRNRNYECKRN